MGRRWLTLPVFLLALPGGVAADGIDSYLAREMALRKIPGLGLAVARDGEIKSGCRATARASRDRLAGDRRFGLRHRFARQAGDRRRARQGGRARQARTRRSGLEVARDRASRRDAPPPRLSPSGLPDDTLPSVEGRTFTDYTTEQLLAQAQGLVPVAPPAHRFLYSDTGLLLAQLATEKAAGSPWWEFMRRRSSAPPA